MSRGGRGQTAASAPLAKVQQPASVIAEAAPQPAPAHDTVKLCIVHGTYMGNGPGTVLDVDAGDAKRLLKHGVAKHADDVSRGARFIDGIEFIGDDE